jgi:hypothetical protein
MIARNRLTGTLGLDWYRGESTNAPSAKPGEWLHDFGDGLYFTDSLEVARRYAELRASEKGGQPRVLELQVQTEQLGRVLDLSRSEAWAKYLRTPLGPKMPTPEQLLHTANENYGRLFNAFLAEEKIDLSKFDAVIGPEFVRGGKQLCVLHVDGKPSSRGEQLRSQMRPVARVVPSQPWRVPVVRATPEMVNPKSSLRSALGSGAGQAAVAMVVTSAINALMDHSIRKATERELERRSAAIAHYINQGSGMLVILRIAQSRLGEPSVRSRWLVSANLQPGRSAEAALNSWRDEPHILQDVPNADIVEDYVWIAPR